MYRDQIILLKLYIIFEQERAHSWIIFSIQISERWMHLWGGDLSVPFWFYLWYHCWFVLCMCLYAIIYLLYVIENLQWSSFTLCFLWYRTQTTQGIWMARATGIDPCTLVMDLEGTDGRRKRVCCFSILRIHFLLWH